MLLKVLFVLSDTFSINEDFVRFTFLLEADTSEDARTIFEERYGNTESDKAYLFELSWLFEVSCFLAEGEALCIEFHEVGDDEHVFDIYVEDALGFEFHQGLV